MSLIDSIVISCLNHNEMLNLLIGSQLWNEQSKCTNAIQFTPTQSSNQQAMLTSETN
uniref:Uncharacterized protein n=1 Tax=Tetranychus urticae TaxID=32264 RepID=T1KF93_TETUR